MKEIILTLMLLLTIPVTTHADDDTFSIAKHNFSLLDKYVESPEVASMLIINFAPSKLSELILTDLAELEDGLISLQNSSKETDAVYEIAEKQRIVVENTANRVKYITDDLTRLIDEYGTDIPTDKLIEFRDDLIQLKFIYADAFGDTGLNKDRIYQELRVEYK